jgi:hypothetical protein
MSKCDASYFFATSFTADLHQSQAKNDFGSFQRFLPIAKDLSQRPLECHFKVHAAIHKWRSK